jgi:hypothetical protein
MACGYSGLALRNLLHQRVQLIEAGFQRRNQRTRLGLIANRLFEQGFHRVGKITHGIRPAMRAPPLSVCRSRCNSGTYQLGRGVVPLRHHAIGVIKDFARLVDEHFKQIGVDKPDPASA